MDIIPIPTNRRLLGIDQKRSRDRAGLRLRMRNDIWSRAGWDGFDRTYPPGSAPGWMRLVALNSRLPTARRHVAGRGVAEGS
jgi:hypothetical protein